MTTCDRCSHKPVCKFSEEDRETCENELYTPDPGTYWDINLMFDPIFAWMNYHYPHGGAAFYVDNDKAQLSIDSGASIYDRHLNRNIK